MYMYICMYGLYKKGLHHSPSKFGNWVTEVCKIKWFLGRKSLIRGVVLRRNCLRATGFFFGKILKRKHDKDSKLVWAKVRYCLQEEILFDIFALFFPIKHRFFTCFEDGCPQLTLFTSHRCAKYCFVKALSAKNLRHCYLCFRNVSCPVSGLIIEESAIISHNSLKELCLVCLAALQF